ncbi:DUF4224 domain-containing protein [Cupriavidus sp. CuC1]|uniref:DUF4224 domain-containing protein n=1 Tax=Cupriavidus sp. CuC1 TaxID=3373131 RepID=UPI0037D550F6
MFLTNDEIRELTKRTHRRTQVEALRTLGIEHRVRADGSIVVLRAHIEAVFGVSAPVARKQKEYEIDRSIM